MCTRTSERMHYTSPKLPALFVHSKWAKNEWVLRRLVIEIQMRFHSKVTMRFLLVSLSRCNVTWMHGKGCLLQTLEWPKQQKHTHTHLLPFRGNTFCGCKNRWNLVYRLLSNIQAMFKSKLSSLMVLRYFRVSKGTLPLLNYSKHNHNEDKTTDGLYYPGTWCTST